VSQILKDLVSFSFSRFQIEVYLKKIDKRRQQINLGQYLRKQRNARRLKQRELAKLINVTEDTVRNWEKNRTRPSRKALKKLARVFIN